MSDRLPAAHSEAQVAPIPGATAIRDRAEAIAGPRGTGRLNLVDGPCPPAALPSDLPATQVHLELRRCLAEMHRAEQSAFLWFTEMVRRRLYCELGYASIQAYAAEELGLTANRVNRYLRLIHDLERLPRIRAALYDGKIGWTKARAVVKVSSPATEGRWLAAARRLGRRQLEAKVVMARMRAAALRRDNPLQAELTPTAGGGMDEVGDSVPSVGRGGGDSYGQPGLPLVDDGPVAVVLRFSPLELARFEAQVEKIRKRGALARGASREQIVLHALEALITETAQPASDGVGDSVSAPGCLPVPVAPTVPRGTAATPYLIVIYKCERCHTAVVQTDRGPLKVASAQLETVACEAVLSEPGKPNRAAIPPALRRAVLTRDQHRCRAVGCTHTRFLEVHHILPRERGGTNRLENLVTLCSRCHALWHERGLDPNLLRPV